MSKDYRRHRREGIVQEQAHPRRIALIERYYPALLRARILACLRRQIWGNFKQCCRDAWCPACSPRESDTRAKSQLAAFQLMTPEGEKPRLAHEVYTLPPLLRPLVASKEGFARWRRATIATTRELHNAEVAGILNLHPLGDRDPTKQHPHWDVVLNGWTITNGKPSKIESPTFDFDHGRAVYIKHLAREFHLTGSSVPEKIDAWWDRKTIIGRPRVWHTSKQKHWHMISYSARNVFQPDKSWLVLPRDEVGDLDWAYKPKKKEPMRTFPGRAVMSNLMAQRAWLSDKMEHVWFGYMHGPQRAKTLQVFRPGSPTPTRPPEDASRADASKDLHEHDSSEPEARDEPGEYP